jgi:uncharacterized Zn finger protein
VNTVQQGTEVAYYRCADCGMVWKAPERANEPIKIIIQPMSM